MKKLFLTLVLAASFALAKAESKSSSSEISSVGYSIAEKSNQTENENSKLIGEAFNLKQAAADTVIVIVDKDGNVKVIVMK